MKNGVTLVLLATFGLALKGIWARLAYDAGLDVSGVLFYRSAFSAPLVAFSGWYLVKKSRSDDAREAAPAFGWTDYVPGILLGAVFSVGMVCDFQAIEELGAGVSRVILFGFPLVVMALDATARRRLPTAQRLGGFSVAWLGLLGVAQGAQGTNGSLTASEGVLWALASMMLYALYVWISGRLTKKLGSVRLTSASNLSTAGVVVAFLLVRDHGSIPPASPAALGWIVLMVLVSTVAPYFLMMEGIQLLGSTEASLLAMTGPVITLAAGGLLLGETMNGTQLLGTSATLLGVAFAQGGLKWSTSSLKERLNLYRILPSGDTRR